MPKASRSGRKAERVTAVRASATGGVGGLISSGVGGVLQLQSEDSDATLSRIVHTLRKRCPTLDNYADDEAGSPYLAASFIAYSFEKKPQTHQQWCQVLQEVLEDAGILLDDDDHDEAIALVIKDLTEKCVLVAPTVQVEPGSMVLALLAEDDDWHEAFVGETLGGGSSFRLIFMEYGKPQDTPLANIRTMDAIVDDEGSEDTTQIGDCEMCGRNLLLTFHHLIPKDTHPTYLKKRLPRGIEGEPTRGFLNSYGTMICRQCHNCVHRLAPNFELASDYNTLEKILAHPLVERWVEWVSKQRSGKYAD